jgi:hypothetical protein
LERFAAARDEDAFAALVRRHSSLVWGVCWRALGQTQDAEDCFQATFLVLARKAAAVGWRDSVEIWLFEVASRVSGEARSKRHGGGRGKGRPASRRRRGRCASRVPSNSVPRSTTNCTGSRRGIGRR